MQGRNSSGMNICNTCRDEIPLEFMQHMKGRSIDFIVNSSLNMQGRHDIQGRFTSYMYDTCNDDVALLATRIARDKVRPYRQHMQGRNFSSCYTYKDVCNTCTDEEYCRVAMIRYIVPYDYHAVSKSQTDHN